MLRDGFHPAMTRRKVSDLIGEAKALRTTLTAAREEVIRLASDPFADPGGSATGDGSLGVPEWCRARLGERGRGRPAEAPRG